MGTHVGGNRRTDWRLGDIHSPLVPFVLRTTGLFFVVFFLIAVPLASTQLANEHHSTIGKLGAWGAGGGFEYVVMIAALNIGLGICLAVAAGDPVRYRAAVDVFLVCESLHMLSMAIMALAPTHHMHLIGDVPLGIGGVALVALVWLPVRAQAYAR